MHASKAFKVMILRNPDSSLMTKVFNICVQTPKTLDIFLPYFDY